MRNAFNITAAKVDPALLDLPWDVPLSEWPDDQIVALPKGLSRHTVRFSRLSGRVIAIKETLDELAHREYSALRQLRKLSAPVVVPVAVLSGRLDKKGEPLPSVLVTRHLKYSMPYRAVFSQTLKEETAKRLVDALALLLVHLHNIGFFWGDVSLSNTLFRRDAGAFAAYLVDAETGQFFAGGLSEGNRSNDLEIARINIAGELMDLASGSRLDDDIDPLAISERIVSQYHQLWQELHGTERFSSADRWRIRERVKRLNDLGFDIDEMSIRTEENGDVVRIHPKVVDAGHHRRRLIRLTGLDVEENQARRLLNDFDEFHASFPELGMDEEQAAHQWLATRFEPIIASIPRELRGKREPAEIFHEIMEHRWYMSEEAGHVVPLMDAVRAYTRDILAHHRDETAVLSPPTEALTLPVDVIDSGADDDEVVDWRAKI